MARRTAPTIADLAKALTDQLAAIQAADRRLLTAAGARRRIGMSKNRWYRLAKLGMGCPCSDVGDGGNPIYHPTVVDEWARTIAAAPASPPAGERRLPGQGHAPLAGHDSQAGAA